MSTPLIKLNLSALSGIYMKYPSKRDICTITDKASKRCEELQATNILKTGYKLTLSKGLGDIHELKNAMKQTFFYDEPSVKLFNLKGNENGGELLNVMMNGICFEDSVIARCNASDKLVGFALNGEFNYAKMQQEFNDWSLKLKDNRSKKLLALWSSLSGQFDYRTVISSARAMEIYYLGVVPQARRQGLAKKMVKESLDVAKDRGYGLVQVVCTSNKSANICEALNMQHALDVDYSCLTIPWDGRPIITSSPPPPNSDIKIYYHIVKK